MSRARALAIIALALVAPASAQTLRLDDVLTTTSAPTQSADNAPLSGEVADALVAQAEADLRAGDVERALGAARVLAARVPAGDPAHATAAMLLARALESSALYAEAEQTVDRLIALDPYGEHAVAATVLKARCRAAGSRWDEAADTWKELFDTTSNAARVIGPAGLLAAGEAFVRAGDAVNARKALGKLDADAEIAAGTRDAATYWTLESLLLQDDDALPVPAPVAEDSPLYAAIELRRALLHELRGDDFLARAIYAELAWRRDKLPAIERPVLDERAAALGVAG